MGVVIKRFDVFLVNLDPTLGSEIQKTRLCLVISPDEMNLHISTVIIAPMTTKGKAYPTRINFNCQFQGKTGQIVLDQIRTIDKSRLVKKLGRINQDEQRLVLDTLAKIFSE
jgi:mRNA interferase MazF